MLTPLLSVLLVVLGLVHWKRNVEGRQSLRLRIRGIPTLPRVVDVGSVVFWGILDAAAIHRIVESGNVVIRIGGSVEIVRLWRVLLRGVGVVGGRHAQVGLFRVVLLGPVGCVTCKIVISRVISMYLITWVSCNGPVVGFAAMVDFWGSGFAEVSISTTTILEPVL